MKNLYATNNGTTSALDSDGIQTKMVSKHSNSQVKDKVTTSLISFFIFYSQIMNLCRYIYITCLFWCFFCPVVYWFFMWVIM